jgi:hypothetical protein
VRAVSRWLLTLCAVPSTLLGQESKTLHEGDQVRITAAADTGIYIVRAVSGDTLVAQLPPSQALVYFPFSSLRKVEVRGAPTEMHVQALQRGVIAAIGAGVAGGLVAYMESSDSDPMATHGDRMAFARNVGGAFALIGFGGGVASGLIDHGERWERVPLPPRLSAIVRGNGVLALSYSF